MSQKEKPDLAAALANVSGSTRHRTIVQPRSNQQRQRAAQASPADVSPEGRAKETYQSPIRSGTAPITVHFPEQVRDQLKILAIERKATLQTLIAEAYNDLFAKYGKPEIAPGVDTSRQVAD